MNNPFKQGADESMELERIASALNGNGKALEKLISDHKDFVYNVVWRMVMNPQDAEDITHDILIKIITNLSKYEGKSRFRTWLYRIAFNHVLTVKKRPIEENILSFDQYGDELDSLGIDEYCKDKEPTPEESMVIKDVMFGCTAGMILCLDRLQRLVFILGDMFEIESAIGAEILDMSRDNFRQRLTRARKDLYSFINNKCGLVNKDNPCRCRNKTKQFIERGYVDPSNLQFNKEYIDLIEMKISPLCNEIDSVFEKSCREIFINHPFQEKKSIQQRVDNVISGHEFKKAFFL